MTSLAFSRKQSAVRRIGCCLLPTAYFLLTTAFGSLASSETPKPKIVVIIVDGMTLEDALTLKHSVVRPFLDKADIGMLSTPTLHEDWLEGLKAGKLEGLPSSKLASIPALQLCGSHKFYEALSRHDVLLLDATISHQQSSKRFIAALLRRLDLKRTIVWLLSPNSAISHQQSAISKFARRLTPIFLLKRGSEGMLLTSATTRRVGLVSAVDFAPTILAQLGIPLPKTTTGHIIKSVPHHNPISVLKRLDHQAAAQWAHLPLMVTFIAVFAGMALLLSLTLVSCRVPRGSWLVQACLLLLLGTILLPVAILLTGPWHHASPMLDVGQVALLALTIAALLCWLGKQLDSRRRGFQPRTGSGAGCVAYAGRAPGIQSLQVACALTLLLFVADMVTGTNLLRDSFIGNVSISGGRYYGVGNDVIGVILASALMSLGLSGGRQWTKQGAALTASLMFFIAWAVGAPKLGANFGGAISLAAGFGVMWVFVFLRRFTWREAAGVVMFILAVAGCVLLTDLMQPTQQRSHIGMLFGQVASEGASPLLAMAAKKLWLHGHYLSSYPIGFAPLAVLVVVTVMLWKLPTPLQHNFNAHPSLQPALKAAVLGTWVALLVNDTGIVSVTTSLQIVVPSILYVVLQNAHLGCGLRHQANRAGCLR